MLRALRRAATARPRTALFAALTYVNVATFIFHVVVSRELGPSRYGALGSILVLTVLVANGTGALTAAVTRTVAIAGPGREFAIDRLMRRAWIAAAATLAVGVAVSGILEGYLHLGSPVPVMMLAVLTAATLVELAPRGVLMGQHRYGPVAVALGLGATVRLVAGATLGAAFGTTGAVAGAAAGECIVALVCGLAAARAAGPRPARRELRIPTRSVSLATGAYSGLWLLAAADTFFARHLFAGHASGLYVAASTAASIALFLPNNVTLAVFPSLAGDAARGIGRSGDFRRAFALAAGLTVVSCAALAALPALAIGVLFGSSYRGAGSLLVLLAFSNGAQGLIGFLQHHQLAHHRATCLAPWAGLLALTAIAASASGSPHRLAWEAVGVSAVLLIAMIAASLRLATRPNEPAVEPDDLAVSLRA